jgi:phosphate-selective porin OprO/OprP
MSTISMDTFNINLLALALGAWATIAAHPGAAAEEPPPSGPGVVVKASADGFSLESADGAFKLHLKGLVQLDGRFYLADEAEVLTNTFLVRRARPILQGAVGTRFAFELTTDFGGGTTYLLDADAVGRVSRGLAITVGKFKPPIGVEHLQSDSALFFLERALPASLEPNRDVGLQVGGDLARGTLHYAAGLFDGAADGAITDLDSNDGKSLVARVAISPFATRRSSLKGLGIGLSASSETQSGLGAPLSGYKTGGQNTFFNYAVGVGPAGRRTRWTPELTFFGGPVGLIAEYVESSAQLRKVGGTATTGSAAEIEGPFPFTNVAWQVAGSVLLTGDTASYTGSSVRRPFDPSKGQWGAVQLVARINGFSADPTTFSRGFADLSRSARTAHAWGVGVSWLMSRSLKQALSFERTTFRGGAREGDRPPENALLFRTELRF